MGDQGKKGDRKGRGRRGRGEQGDDGERVMTGWPVARWRGGESQRWAGEVVKMEVKGEG